MPEAHEPESPRNIWFDGETFRAIRDRMNAAGPDARLVFNAPFNEHATVEVTEPGVDAAARLKPLNEAHPCPPQC